MEATMKRILVPLDQTIESEALVPLVADAARSGGATVRLLYVAPTPDALVDADGRTIAYADQEGARLEAMGLDYLRTIEIGLPDVPVESVVRFGDPAEEIIREATDFGADLIALTTRCRTGLRRFAPGGTAARVCREADAAVLLLRPAHVLAA
jgi:nucleotide-binding universal stress UspA family protein